MEKQLNSVLLLSLEEMALRKVAVLLWNQIDILALFEVGSYISFFCRDGHLSGNQIKGENLIKGRLSELMLTETVLNKVICVIKPVGLEITKWMRFHCELLIDPVVDEEASDIYLEMFFYRYDSNLDRKVLLKLCWSSLGTVDYRKTAEELICHNMLDSVQRYRLACHYCLDAYIPILWENLSEENKDRFCDEEELKFGFLKLELCWPYILRGEKSKLDSMFGNPAPFYQYAFERSACEFNEVAAQYFYQKLTFEERESSLLNTAKTVANILIVFEDILVSFREGNFSGTLRYLLIQLSLAQQMELLREFPVRVLSCFLKWPWQHLLLENVELIWDILSGNQFYFLLWYLYKNLINLECSNLDLFWNFFLHSQNIHKRYFIEKECEHANFFRKFFIAEDIKTIAFILRNMDVADKVRLVFCSEILKMCQELLKEDKWHLLGVFIREATLSKGDRERLKNAFKQHILIHKNELKCESQKLERFFELVDEPDIGNYCKRNLEDEQLAQNKKLCTEK